MCSAAMKTLSAVLVYLIVLKTSFVFCSNVACVQECDTNTTGLFDCSNRQCSLLPLPPLAAEYKFTTILLNNNELTDINSQLNAESIYPDADFIDFSFNRINYIFKNVFDDLMSLRTLNLSNNLLNVFDFGLFDSTKNIEKVNLKSNSIKTLHGSSYVIYVKHLDLSDNLLRSLDKAFTYCLSLTHLNLSRNQIEAIEKDDFDQLALLEVLDLYDNEIKEISDKALDSLSHLQLLDLRNNYINTLTADTFNQLSALSTLLLSENRLKAVSTAVFSPLYRLCYLHIEMNPLEIIEVEGDLPGSLQEIRLAYTNLKVISNGTLANLAYLNDVVISNNDQLTMIDTGVFSGQTFYAVRRLSIANNALKSLSSDLLDWNLVEQVDASGNHWACNCSMGWIKSSNIANVSGNTFK